MMSCVVSILFFISAITDSHTRRVPNIFPLTIALLGCYTSFVQGRTAIVASLLAGLFQAILWGVLWRSRLIGGADHKLLIAGAFFGDIRQALLLSIFTAVAGGMVAVIYYLVRAVTARSSLKMVLRSRAATLPYAWAIFAAWLLVTYGKIF